MSTGPNPSVNPSAVIPQNQTTGSLSTTDNRMLQAPEWTKKYDEHFNMKEINKAVKPPFVKIIHPQSGEPYKPAFKDFDIIVAPNNVKVGDAENAFVFTPLLYFRTWQIVNPFEMKGKLPFVRAMTYDETHEIAKKAKRFHKDDKCPEFPGKNLEYNEVHNIFMVIEGFDELKNLPVWLPLSRGEYKTGASFVGDMQRLPARPPMCRFRAFSEMHKNPQYKWIGLRIMHDTQPFVSEQRAEETMAMYKVIEKLIDDRAFDLESSDDQSSNGDAANETCF